MEEGKVSCASAGIEACAYVSETMALEAVVFPQDLFGYTCKDLYSTMGGGGGGGGAWGYELGLEEKDLIIECNMGSGNWDTSCSSWVQNHEECNLNSSSPDLAAGGGGMPMDWEAGDGATGRKKRRRAKSMKNKEEVENQRMTHIAVERNRRKQMNEYLAVLRSLMPPSYVQRGDQASIVGGAINYVKELEQILQSLEVQKRLKQRTDASGLISPFANFFTFPQYSCSSTSSSSNNNNNNNGSSSSGGSSKMMAEGHPAMADVEVTMVESHANLKVLSRRRPKQLLKMVVGLQNLRFTPLHLNVTTLDQMVLYSFSLKVEDDCQFTSVDEIATAVYQMLGRIEEEANFRDNVHDNCLK